MSSEKSFFYRNSAEVFLFLAAFFIRFPFFFRDYIDKDESTFILMGQSIADGHLPYDHLWDLKPPLLFYFFALVEKIFPHSFVAIRFSGVIIVFLSALFLLKIARHAKLKNGFLIALGYVLLSSEFGSLQGVMSEHFSVFFLLLSLIFFFQKRNVYELILAGIAFGSAILCKLNYAYAIAALITVYLLMECRKKNLKQAINHILFLITGIVIPVILIAVPYILSGKTGLFVNSVFLAPLEYARAMNYSWIDKLKTISWVIVLTVLISYLAIKFSKEENKSTVLIFIALCAGTVYTFYSSGIVNGHYLVQVYPFVLILFAGAIIQKDIRINFSIAALAVVLLSFESISEYYLITKSYIVNSTFYRRQSFEIVKELKQKQLDKEKIFFADYHIGYWILNQLPLTKSSTHPSNLARPYLFKYFDNPNKTSMEELKYLMEQVKPDVVVSKYETLNFFPGNSEENLYFKKLMNQNFSVIRRDEKKEIFIWERKNQN